MVLLEKDGIILLVQLDHLSGEEVGWMLETFSHPGVRNRNLIPTHTKKGRIGCLLLLDIDPSAESEIASYLMKDFTTYGYHRIKTGHVYRQTSLRTVTVTVTKGELKVTASIRLKHDIRDEQGPFFMESDDLVVLHQKIRDELNGKISPWLIRRRIEEMAGEEPGDTIHLYLKEG